MSATINWCDEQQTIIHTTLNGNVSSDELRNALSDTHDIMHSVTNRVDVFLDIGDAVRMPGNFLSVLANCLNQTPDNFGMMVFIGDNTYIGSLAMTFWRVYPFESKRISLAATLEAAISFINEQRNAQV